MYVCVCMYRCIYVCLHVLLAMMGVHHTQVFRHPKKGKYTLHAQGKMTNTMTMQEQIETSGLEIMSSLSSSSSSSSQLQWNSTNQWSPILGGGREYQACVTIDSGNENGAGGQTIVVIGGEMEPGEYTNSVIVWDPSTKRWRNGPTVKAGV